MREISPRHQPHDSLRKPPIHQRVDVEAPESHHHARPFRVIALDKIIFFLGCKNESFLNPLGHNVRSLPYYESIDCCKHVWAFEAELQPFCPKTQNRVSHFIFFRLQPKFNCPFNHFVTFVIKISKISIQGTDVESKPRRLEAIVKSQRVE
jgi:hypothetical protein